MIPKLIHMIWLDNPVPKWAEVAREAWTEMNPGWEMHWHCDDRELLPALKPFWDKALWPSVRSDLLRLSILARFGGVYVDTDTLPVHPLDTWIPPLDADVLMAAHMEAGPDTWFLATAPGSKAIRHAIEIVLSHRAGDEIGQRTFACQLLNVLRYRWPDLLPEYPWAWFTTGDRKKDRAIIQSGDATQAHEDDAVMVLHYYASNAQTLW